MRRVWTLVAVSAVALSFGADVARAAHIDTTLASSPREGASAVTALSVVPGDGRAEIIITVSGPVSVQDFTVPSPHRVVVDLTGARLASLGNAYDGIARAGIKNVRVAQYRADVVRIVLDMDRERSYTIDRDAQQIRLSIESFERFAAWHSGNVPAAAEVVAETETDSAETSALDSVVASAGSVVTPQAAVIPVAAKLSEQAPVVAPALARLTRVSLFGQQSQQQRITVTYQDADIRDVLAAFASFSGRTIVVGKEVAGTVTAEIKDQPWDVALKAILEAQGLAATEETSGIITVDSYENILAKQASEPVATQLVNINYVSASSLVETVRGLLSKDCPQGAAGAQAQQQQPGTTGGCIIRGNIAADSGTNSLLVTEVASRMQDLLQYVRELDVRTPQVALKAKILSLSRTQLEQLGVSYDLGSNAAFFNTLAPRISQTGGPSTFEYEVSLGGDALAGVANASRRYRQGSALNLIFSTALGKFSLTSFLDALREQQISDVQAEPSIVTLDNRQARILVGQETPVRVIDAGSAGQIGAPVRANVQFRETGIILTVTPHITNNRQIRMTMEAEQSELRIVGGDLGFIIDKRNARTQTLVNDGETAIIAGLTQTLVTKNKSGIPILTDLPLIGRLFSQTDTREEKRDLLILITPHIIDEGEPVRPPSGPSGR
jgi:type IV pilus assembly protein PilQ